MAITGKKTLNHTCIVEVDSDPRVSIDENCPIGSLALWPEGPKGRLFLKRGAANLSWFEQVGLNVAGQEGHHLVFKNGEWVSKIPKRHAIAVGDIGSDSSANNQQFSIDLTQYGFEIGDNVRIGNAYVRGDFSSNNEYLNVGINSISDPRVRVGQEGYEDSDNFRSDGHLIDRIYPVIDIGNNTPGLFVFVDPTGQVNSNVGDLPNDNEWELKLDVLVV